MLHNAIPHPCTVALSELSIVVETDVMTGFIVFGTVTVKVFVEVGMLFQILIMIKLLFKVKILIV